MIDKPLNLFSLPEQPLSSENGERFDILLRGNGPFHVERIVSDGHTTPQGEWYDQEKDEWVVVLEGSARLGFADGAELSLTKGCQAFLPKHTKHRVTYTSSPCIWLAIHADLEPA